MRVLLQSKDARKTVDCGEASRTIERIVNRRDLFISGDFDRDWG